MRPDDFCYFTMDVPAFERHLAHLRRDFHIDADPRTTGDAYRRGIS